MRLPEHGSFLHRQLCVIGNRKNGRSGWSKQRTHSCGQRRRQRID
jgi:hypothetical protein